jgi:4-hydroxyisophthalate hydroxylase
MSFDCEVVISGGGPVGLGLAVSLGQRGVRTVLLERYMEPQPIPRGQNLTQRTMEHFHFWGIERELRAARTIPPEFGIGGLTAYGSLFSGHHHDWMKRELVRPYYLTDNERLPQYATEAVLRARLAELPCVETLFGWSVTDIRQDDDSVTFEAAERKGAGRRTIRAVYGVGCDGSRSIVRDQAGITQTRSDHDRVMVLLVFRSEELHGLLARFPGKSFFNVITPELAGYWKFFGRVDLGSTFFFHAPVPSGTTRDNFDFQALLDEAAGVPFAAEIAHIGFWDLRFAVADSYSSGRLFIAGDAAHSHPPYGGYGINTGFEDAVNLAWKLDAALKGWAGPGLLDSYSQERQPVFVSTARDFIEMSIRTDREFVAAFCPDKDRAAFDAAWRARTSDAVGEVHSYCPHYEGSPVVCGSPGGRSSAMGQHAFTARAGHHLSPQVLSDGRNVFDALGPGLTLLALGPANPGVTAFEVAAKRLRVPLGIVQDPAGHLAEHYGARLVIVRPDQYVAWVDETGDFDADAVLARIIGR